MLEFFEQDWKKVQFNENFLQREIPTLNLKCRSEPYSESCQTVFCENIFPKRPILDVLQGSEYTSAVT